MRNRMNVLLAILLSMALAGLAFASGGKEAEKKAASTMKKEMLFWASHPTGPENQAAIQKLVDQYNQENTDVNIKYELVTGTAVYPKFLTAAQSGSMPDMADGYAFHPLQFAAMGTVTDVDDIIALWEKEGRIKNLSNEQAYKKFFWNGHYWGIPWMVDIRGILYRKDMLAEAGIKPPTTWDEFTKAVIALNKPEKGIYGLSMPAGYFHITQHFYMMFMLQAGGSLIDEKGNLVFGTSARDANIQALRYMTDFATKYKAVPPGAASYDSPDMETVFLQGKAAFIFARGDRVARLINEFPQLLDKVGVLDTLQGPKAKLTAGFYNAMFGSKSSKYIPEAKKFVKWMSDPGRLEPVYKARPGQTWPIWRTDFNLDVWKNVPLGNDILNKIVAYTVDFTYPGTGVPQLGAIDGEKMFAKPVNDVVTGARTPEQAVDDAHKEMLKLWQK